MKSTSAALYPFKLLFWPILLALLVGYFYFAARSHFFYIKSVA